MSKAETLVYADRAERYLRQRGIAYDEHTISIGHLTPAQRRRSLHKERHAWAVAARKAGIAAPRQRKPRRDG